jgi:hypothetical protein
LESQANEFAANLLMPLDDFRNNIGAKDFPSLNQLGGSAERYAVSLIAAILRWLSYTSRRSVLVVSTEGFVLWSRSSDPALKSGLFLKVKNKPPIELSAGSLARQRDKISNSNFAADHDAHVWFNQPCREQVLFADQYDFTISLLHFDDAGSTFIVEEEEREEDTFERFERRVPGQSWLS